MLTVKPDMRCSSWRRCRVTTGHRKEEREIMVDIGRIVGRDRLQERELG